MTSNEKNTASEKYVASSKNYMYVFLYAILPLMPVAPSGCSNALNIASNPLIIEIFFSRTCGANLVKHTQGANFMTIVYRDTGDKNLAEGR